jgi:predicted NACHT family NTPase
MTEPNSAVVGALVAKRAEIAGEIAALQKKIQAYQDDLVHVDHTLRLFDPTISGWDKATQGSRGRLLPAWRTVAPDLRGFSATRNG